MARREIILLSSDISGEDIPDGGGRTVTFALDVVTYEIDLLNSEVDALADVLTPYMEAGKKVARSGKGYTRTDVAPKRDLNAVRTWARSKGMDVSDRGRVAKNILEAYDAAN